HPSTRPKDTKLGVRAPGFDVPTLRVARPVPGRGHQTSTRTPSLVSNLGFDVLSSGDPPPSGPEDTKLQLGHQAWCPSAGLVSSRWGGVLQRPPIDWPNTTERRDVAERNEMRSLSRALSVIQVLTR